MQIVSWNPRARRATAQTLLSILRDHEPEALCLHDSDVLSEDFPLHELYDLGYYVKIHGVQGGGGVALLSPEPPRAVRREEAPVLSGLLASIRVLVGSGDRDALCEHVRSRVAPHELLLVVDPGFPEDLADALRLTRLAPGAPFFAREPLRERFVSVEELETHPALRLEGLRPLEIPDRDVVR